MENVENAHLNTLAVGVGQEQKVYMVIIWAQIQIVSSRPYSIPKPIPFYN